MAWECRPFLNPFIKNLNEVVLLYKVFTSVPRIYWLSIMQTPVVDLGGLLFSNAFLLYQFIVDPGAKMLG